MAITNINFTTGFCPAVQQLLNNITAPNAPQMMRSEFGYIQALNSVENTSLAEKITFGEGGKYRQVQVRYQPRGLASDVTITTAPLLNNCIGAGIIIEPLQVNVDINKRAFKTIRFDMGDMARICEPNDVYMGQTIMSLMDGVLRAIDTDIIASQAAAFGLYQDGSASKSFNLITAVAPQAANVHAQMLLNMEYRKIGFAGTPIVIGGDVANIYAEMTGMGCCNNGGLDISQARGKWNFYYDSVYESVVGANRFMSLAPGSVHLLEWYQNVGQGGWTHGNSSRGTIVDPVTGITFDIGVVFDDSCGTYDIEISKYYEIFFVPSTAFDAADVNNGVRGTLNALAI